MFNLIYILLLFPIVFVWARFLFLAAEPLLYGITWHMAVTEFFYPTLAVTTFLCLLIFYGIKNRLSGFRTGGIWTAVFFIFSGPGMTFPVRGLIWGDLGYLIAEIAHSPLMWLWIADFAALIFLLNLPAVKQAFAADRAGGGTGHATRFANKVCLISYWLFIGMMFLIRAFSHQPNAKMWILVMGMFLVAGLLSGGWLAAGSWDVTAFPVLERVVLFFILLMLIMAWSMTTLQNAAGGQHIRPNLYFMFMAAGLQSGVVASYFDIVKEQGRDLKALLRYCGIGMIFVALFLILQHFDHLEYRDLSGISAYDAPARMRYLPFGKWFDGGTQQFGGWGATFLALPYFCGHLAYAFTIALTLYTGLRFRRGRTKPTAAG
ncbi:MAG: hypothetical protein KC897_11885 [Candidatus Omnitrophica bacterium]|nr:hypothetical protein [Candidatus Omnitrophota bacterium]MCB9720130.1 hypothetical protein [Candidatus Omnitrophota bacterium]